ncbi:MAG: hypothetical protein R3D51_06500 [Hyphomicrobiaceae bacterium]
MKAIFDFALAKGFGQAAGLLSGLIYVRAMPVEQYALFGLCMTAISMMSVGSDLGITGSLSYFWRRGLQEKTNFDTKLALVRRIRDILFVLAGIAGAFMLLSSAPKAGHVFTVVSLCFGLALAQTWLQMNVSVSSHVLLLEGRQRTSYIAEASGSAVRLVAALLMLVSGATSAVFALIGGLLGASATAAYIKRNERSYWTQERPSPQDSADLRRYFISVLPSVLVFTFRDPLVMWLTATRAGTVAVADVFALSRISLIFAIIGNFATIVVVPRLATITDDRTFAKSLAGALTIQAGICAMLFAVTLAAPQLILLLIGSKYAHLTAEVVILAATASASVLTSFLVLCARLRGWVGLDPPLAVLQLGITLAACFNWPFQSTADVLYLNLLLAAVGLGLSVLVMLIGWRVPHLVEGRGRREAATPQ